MVTHIPIRTGANKRFQYECMNKVAATTLAGECERYLVVTIHSNRPGEKLQTCDVEDAASAGYPVESLIPRAVGPSLVVVQCCLSLVTRTYTG